jgi:hypothetical protein
MAQDDFTQKQLFRGSSPGYLGASFAVVASEPSGDVLLYGSGLRLMSVNGQPGLGVARLQLNLPNPRIEVDAGSAQVLETNGVVNLTLVRTGNTTAPFTVLWETSGGTADPGVDYQPGAGTLTFGG